MVTMGRIMGPFGVYGWVKVNPYTEYIDGLTKYSEWWLTKDNKNWQVVHFVAGRMNGNILNAKFEEYTDRTQVLPLSGMRVAIPRIQLPELSEDGKSGHYWSDLIGTAVHNLQGEELGRVIGFFETGANDVLCIQNANKDKEILIPFVKQFIIKVDLKLSRITVDWGIDY